MYHYRPAQIRTALTTLIASITPESTYYRKAADTWHATEEPLAADLAPDQSIISHLAFYVDIREVQEWEEGGSVQDHSYGVRVPVTVWYLCLLSTLGSKARVNSTDSALEAGRHLFRYLLENAESTLPDTTMITGPGTLYRISPIPATDVVLGEVRFTLLTRQSLEV